MARPRALPDAEIFALANQLRAGGEEPSVTKLAERAKAAFGVTPSYTTLKGVLNEWRQFEAAALPTDLPPEFLTLVLGALTPLYGRLLAQVRAELEPKVLLAEQQREQAEARRDRLESDRTRLLEEVTYLRRQLEELTARDQATAAAYAELAARAAALESTRASAVTRAEELAKELTTVRSALETAEVAHRRQAAGWQAEREELQQRHLREQERLREAHTASLAQRQDEHARALQEKHTQLQQREALLAAERETLLGMRATADELLARVHTVNDALLVARGTLERQAAELSAVTAARDQLVVELRAARAEYHQERGEYRARIQTLEAQITSLVEGRSALDQRYEGLLDVLNQQQQKPQAAR